jgi:dethiobiotin synthetase
MNASRYFIASTGTEQGKTLLTAALSFQLDQKGIKVQPLKPIISGFGEAFDSDSGILLRSIKQPVSDDALEHISPWRFREPLSPDYAARLEGRSVALSQVVDFCNQQRRVLDHPAVQLIEGAGGIMSPLTAEHTNLDLASALQCPVILVAGSYLGCISHLLTALRVLAQEQIPLQAIWLNEAPGNRQPADQVLASLRHHLPATARLQVVKALESRDDLWKSVPDLTATIETE